MNAIMKAIEARVALLGAIVLVGLSVSGTRSAEPTGTEHHLLYVAAPGIRNDLQYGGAGILVFDIDQNTFVKRIETPASQVAKPENIKGICANARTQRLYFTTLTKLYCLDLRTEKTLWEKALPGGCDRMSITPDGKLLYVPSLEGPHWNVVDAGNGELITQIETNSGSHNTICSLDGSRAYLAGLRSRILSVVDTKHAADRPVGGPLRWTDPAFHGQRSRYLVHRQRQRLSRLRNRRPDNRQDAAPRGSTGFQARHPQTPRLSQPRRRLSLRTRRRSGSSTAPTATCTFSMPRSCRRSKPSASSSANSRAG